MSEELLSDIKEWLEHCSPNLVGRPDFYYAHERAFEIFTKLMNRNEEVISELQRQKQNAYEHFKIAKTEEDRRYNHGAIDAFNNVIELLEENAE